MCLCSIYSNSIIISLKYTLQVAKLPIAQKPEEMETNDEETVSETKVSNVNQTSEGWSIVDVYCLHMCSLGY